MKPITLTLAVAWLLTVASGSALASTPLEKVVCTDLPPAR